MGVFSMVKSMKYFEEEYINKFEKLEDNFMKEPQELAEYVLALIEENLFKCRWWSMEQI